MTAKTTRPSSEGAVVHDVATRREREARERVDGLIGTKRPATTPPQSSCS